MADELIKKYADNSSFSALLYDRNTEEAIVRKIFKDAVLTAGDYLTTPQRSTERFLRILSSHERFRKYLEAGITEDLMAYEMENRSQLFQTPQTVSWERIIMNSRESCTTSPTSSNGSGPSMEKPEVTARGRSEGPSRSSGSVP